MTPLGCTFRQMLLKSSRNNVTHMLDDYENLIAQSIQKNVEYSQNIIPPSVLLQGDDAIKKYKAWLLSKVQEDADQSKKIIDENNIPLRDANDLWVSRTLYAASHRNYFQLIAKPKSYWKQLKLGTRYYIKLSQITPRFIISKITRNAKIQGASPAFWILWLILLVIAFFLFNANDKTAEKQSQLKAPTVETQNENNLPER